jgi:FkbM family methyltransferase
MKTADPGVEIFNDGLWVRRVGELYFPDPEYDPEAEPQWEKWLQRGAKYLRDAEDYWFHVYKPQAGDVIVDIGAGRGEDVFAFSRAVGPEGVVWAVEAHPVSFAALDLFCRLNGLDNVRRVHMAATSEPLSLQIETLPVWESNYLRAGEPTETSHSVEGLPFDDYAAEHAIGRIDFIKMNIEGAERWALPGMRECMKRARFACISAHDFRARRGDGEEFRTRAFVEQFMRKCGFILTSRDDDPRYYVPDHIHGWRAEA